jgi:hypothetical protein
MDQNIRTGASGRRKLLPTFMLLIMVPVWVLFFIAARMLPFVPDALPILAAINGCIGIFVAMLFFADLRRAALKKKKVYLKIPVAVIPAAIVLIGWISTIELAGVSGLAGEERVETVVEQRSGRTFYVYEKSSIPDGFRSARVAVKYEKLPFEKTLATVAEPLQRVVQEDGVVVFLFGRAGVVRVDMNPGAEL